MIQSPVPHLAHTSENAPPARSTFAGSTDFTVFLKMLTTQMQNQNPLNPVEASDFAVQLATFSGVEQQVQTNQLLTRLTERLFSDDMAQWLDTEVAHGNVVRNTGEPLSLSLPAVTSGASRRDVVLTTSDGREVLRLPVSLTRQDVQFDPSPDGTTPLLSGEYLAKVEDFRGADLMQIQGAAQFARVSEVRRAPEGVILVLNGGATANPADITAIRRP